MVRMALARNKKAFLNYEIMDTYEAGVSLAGFEVKSLKEGRGSLDGSFVSIRGGEAFLSGAHIPPHQPANAPKEYDSRRPRKLLLHKKELRALAGAESMKGLTIIPISVYIKNNKVKVEIAVARGKKKYDKRETIKKKDAARDVAREAKARLR